MNVDKPSIPEREPSTQGRVLSLELPGDVYGALEGFAAQDGLSPDSVAAACLIDAIGRRRNDHETVAMRTGRTGERLGLVWEGPFLGLHSLAQVNREFCSRLIGRGHELALIPPKVPDREAQACAGGSLLEGRSPQSLRRTIAAHVRHQWPPSFIPPPDGHWVIVQPWEFGSVPRSWVGPMTDFVDEIWAYTHFVRESYVSGGIPEDRVHVVPLGIDPLRFHPGARRFSLRTAKMFKFLFVGGTIHRKGIDLLLDAYATAFTEKDPVCLVIKDMGGTSFYRGQTAEERIARIRERPGAPEIEYLDRDLGDDELAGLYTACDCLVHPYRGEGFGLPIAEAMSSGLPVIVTGHGAATDYCNEDHAYLIPARIMRFRDKRIGDLETVDFPWLAEPDPEVLRSLLREVADHRDDARAKGRAAASYVRSHLTWDRAVDALESRLEQLRQRPIRRFTASRGRGGERLDPGRSRSCQPSRRPGPRRFPASGSPCA